MEASSGEVTKAFEALVASSERLLDLARRIGTRPGVRSAQQSMHARKYESTTGLEIYVDVELISGRAVVWGLELSWTENEWTIEHFVRANDEQGQYTVRDFPVRRASTAREMIGLVAEATSLLVADAELADLTLL